MNVIETQKNKNIISDLIIVIFQIIVFFSPYLMLGFENANVICVISFMINGVVFIIGTVCAQKKHSISMELVYWIFMFFFMYFAPVIQYLLSAFPWRGYLSSERILYANFIILVFNFCFIVGGIFAKRVRIKISAKTSTSPIMYETFEFKKTLRIIVTVIVVFLALYSLSRTGITGIVASRAQATQVFYSGSNSAIELIVEAVVPSFIAYAVAESAQSMVGKKENGVRFLVLFICLLICFFPTTIPRYKTATIYGVIFLVMFPQIKKGTRFFWVFVIAIFFAFPILSSVRNVISMDNLQSVFKNGFLENYVEGDYDAYRMLASAIRYNQINGCSWGYQLLGVFLFFVPKSFWPAKPIGSGAMLIRAELGNNTFANVSCPFVAEGYINFGMMGVILFAIFLGILINNMDVRYWRNTGAEHNIVFSPYLFMVFMLFFVLRGDLLSGFAYVCGFVVMGYILKIVAKYI